MPTRLAALTDIVRLHEIRTSVAENRLSSPDRIRYQDYVTRLEGQGRGWVFETEGTVVAFGIADVEARSIWALFVEPGFEGRGIGRASRSRPGVPARKVGWAFRSRPGISSIRARPVPASA